MGKELRSLISRQNELKEELSKVLDGASDTLTEEQEKRCKQLKDSIVSLGSQIEYRALADEAERAQGAIEGQLVFLVFPDVAAGERGVQLQY